MGVASGRGLQRRISARRMARRSTRGDAQEDAPGSVFGKVAPMGIVTYLGGSLVSSFS